LNRHVKLRARLCFYGDTGPLSAHITSATDLAAIIGRELPLCGRSEKIDPLHRPVR
jgi:hypothetical protein